MVREGQGSEEIRKRIIGAHNNVPWYVVVVNVASLVMIVNGESVKTCPNTDGDRTGDRQPMFVSKAKK